MHTVEAALVLSALTVTAGTMVGGFLAIGEQQAAQSWARNIARAQTLATSEHSAAVPERPAVPPEYTVHTATTTIAGQPAIVVEVSKQHWLPIRATATSILERAGTP